MGKSQNLDEGGAQNWETPNFGVKMPRFGVCSYWGLEARQEFQLLGFAEDFLLIPLSCSLDHLESPKSRILTPKFTALTPKFTVLTPNLAFFTQISGFSHFSHRNAQRNRPECSLKISQKSHQVSQKSHQILDKSKIPKSSENSTKSPQI